jgi:hypothetical protein
VLRNDTSPSITIAYLPSTGPGKRKRGRPKHDPADADAPTQFDLDEFIATHRPGIYEWVAPTSNHTPLNFVPSRMRCLACIPCAEFTITRRKNAHEAYSKTHNRKATVKEECILRKCTGWVIEGALEWKRPGPNQFMKA